MEVSSLGLDVDPGFLPLGTRIGAWRVIGLRGRGAYGAVYKAVRVGHEAAGPVALKLAVYPRDPRFEREAVVLSRIRHPCVPRLHYEGAERLTPSPVGLLGHRVRRREREVVRVAVQADVVARREADPPRAEVASRVAAPQERGVPRERPPRWVPWLAVTAACAVALWPRGTGPGRAVKESTAEQGTPGGEGRDGGSVSVGDTALTSSYGSMKEVADSPSGGEIVAESPPKLLPGQLKPDANGRCRKGQFAINGGCWLKVDVTLEDCPGNGFVYKGSCYAPIFPAGREPTSAPMK